MTKVFIFGYPGDMGGANTECWHTVKLWRKHDLDVHFIPTWGDDTKWQERLDSIGCVTHYLQPNEIESLPDLPGAITIGFCNSEYITQIPQLRALGCKIVWVNCMTFMFDYERVCFEEHGSADAMIYQSEFQRTELERELKSCNYDFSKGHLIRGAFDLDEWKFQPQNHLKGDPFVVGRVARPDPDKWSCNTWKIYSQIQYNNRRALMLGVNEHTLEKLGTTPSWADCLKPMAISAQQYYTCLHCLLPVNGGARENWPRAGLEAFATGVPVVAQNEWGWKEMIEHGVTGFLGNDDCELAHYAAVLAHDEKLRMEIVHNAYEKLKGELANPEEIWKSWNHVFESVCTAS